MNCPVCREPMIVVEYHDIELDYCSACHGTWFDRGEIDLLLRSMELEEKPSLLNRLVHQPQRPGAEAARKCPVCHARMSKHCLSSVAELTIDTCAKEHGIWFDAGEVQRLISAFKLDAKSAYGSEQELVSFIGEVFEAGS
ncbi:MAG: zf-TFIIB domain-containing protein [Dehalococcoidaceae bacterium]|nr:zf-TFIIB domain-containing protein [Dehalococcoidaceae bacterium]